MPNYKPLDGADEDVILGLAECNMCVSQTAKKVYLAQYTTWKRIYKIRTLTGLDPLNFYDLVELVQAVKDGKLQEMSKSSN